MHLLYFALLAAFCASQEIDFSRPVNPEDYQEFIGQGFSTNYFKANNPARKYRRENIEWVKKNGFHNLRLRCRADHYDDGYTTPKFQNFLEKLEEVVDECISQDVAPIISWIHHEAEADATEEEFQKYGDWWERVAMKLQNKSYLLSYNLFTELGTDTCFNESICDNRAECCADSLRLNKDKYYQWTAEAISKIRGTDGKNAERILILASPEKTSEGLAYIDPDEPYMDPYMMVEWHEYAAGPDSREGRPRYWSGNGNDQQKSLLREGVERATSFTETTNIPTYFGAWMPQDNNNGGLNQAEVESFTEFFVSLLRDAGLPWSLNVLDDYYDTKEDERMTGIQKLAGAELNMSLILDTMLEAM